MTFFQRATAGLVLFASSAALACPVCGQPTDQNQGAYMGMTIMMSLLPLAAIGGLVYWLARQMRE